MAYLAGYDGFLVIKLFWPNPLLKSYDRFQGLVTNQNHS